MTNLFEFDPTLAPLFYLFISLILGASLGLERSLAGKTAGIRTYGLVSMGSSLFILIARYVIPTVESFNYDPLRIAAGIVMGVGFLCGGVIIFKDSHLSGLTTAAGLWVAAGIGMAVGYGLVTLAFFATMTTLLVFTAFWFFEQKVIERRTNVGEIQ
jgi:putative Mg2+ transporter-C (MgtC) family protein